MIRRRFGTPATIGTRLGLVAAIVALTAAGAALVRSDGNTGKVLVAVWLWTLPVLGLFGLIGWSIGRGIEQVTARRDRSR